MTEFKTQPNIGRRIIAGIIDYAIIYEFLIIYLFVFGAQEKNGVYSVSGIKSLPPMIFWLTMTVGIEQLIGKTLGNSLVDLKPISIKKNQFSTFKTANLKPTFGQSFKRHLLDPIDMFFFGLVGILTINNSDKNQRLGDMWSKTIVVKTSELKKLNKKTYGNNGYK